jgi:GntR family transcriptional regulator of arabinose operon
MAGNGKSKQRQIYEHVRNAILSGAYAVGQRIPTEAELCEQFDACRQTVSQAVRQLEQQGLVSRRRGAGTFVQRRSIRRSDVFGLLIPDAHSGVFAPITAAMTSEAQEQGYGILLEDLVGAPDERWIDRAHQLCEFYIERGVAGVFFAPLVLRKEHLRANIRIAEAFDAAGIPMVLLDRDIYAYPRRSKFDLVGVANRRSAQMLTEHLIGLGYRKIGFVAHPASASTVAARIAGYQDALLDHGIEAREEWVDFSDVRAAGFMETKRTRGLLEAYVCVNDNIAAYFMHDLAKAGVHVPQDVAVVGFDDVEYAMLARVPLTTARQPSEHIGEMAIRVMIERLAEPSLPVREISFDCELVVRESCGANLRGRSATVAQSP